MGHLLTLAKQSAPPSPHEAEIRALLVKQCPEGHPDFPEALRVALADPKAALDALRAPRGAP